MKSETVRLIARKVAIQVAETAGLIAVDQAVRTVVNHYLSRRMRVREEKNKQNAG